MLEMRHPSTLVGGALFLVSLERVTLTNTLNSEMLAGAFGSVGVVLGLVGAHRAGLIVRSHWRAALSIGLSSGLLGVAIGSAVNRLLAADAISVETFKVEEKWIDRSWKVGREPWHMLRLRSEGNREEDVSVAEAVWRGVEVRSTIDLPVRRGGLGFEIVEDR
jgi:hypothetical protein